MCKKLLYVVGQDKRMFYVAEFLKAHHFTVTHTHYLSLSNLCDATYFIGSPHFYQDNHISSDYQSFFKMANTVPLSYSNDPSYLKENAKLVAEDFLSTFITNTSISLFESNILLIGLGQYGSEIFSLFSKYCYNITCLDHIPIKLEKGIAYTSIINTTENHSIQLHDLMKIHPNCTLFDLSNAWYPIKSTCPKTAGYLIGKIILRQII